MEQSKEGTRAHGSCAVQFKQKLVVYYFKGEKGKGGVKWEDLRKDGYDPWDGKGLGGSQKAEVAWLDLMVTRGFKEYDFKRQDAEDFQREL
eukprot:gene11229-2991_t